MQVLAAIFAYSHFLSVEKCIVYHKEKLVADHFWGLKYLATMQQVVVVLEELSINNKIIHNCETKHLKDKCCQN